MTKVNININSYVAFFISAFSFYSYFLYQTSPLLKGIFHLLLVVFLVLSFCSSNRVREVAIFVLVVLLLIIISTVSGAGLPQQNIASVSFYFCIILGFFYSKSFGKAAYFSKIFLLINLVFMSYEFYSFSYFYTPETDLAQFFGRAKGLLAYSKEAANFIVMFSIIFIRQLSVKWYVLIMMFAFLTGSRLAIIICGSLVLFEFGYKVYCKSDKKKSLNSIFGFLFLLAVLMLYFSLEQSDVILSRLFESFDAHSSSNSERIHYWLSHLKVYDSQSVLYLIFGHASNSSNIVGNGAESAWISLLNDGGIIAVLLYLASFIVVVFLEDEKVRVFFAILVLIVSMQISRFNLGFIDAPLYWAWVCYLIIRKEEPEARI